MLLLLGLYVCRVLNKTEIRIKKIEIVLLLWESEKIQWPQSHYIGIGWDWSQHESSRERSGSGDIVADGEKRRNHGWG